jgi:hypothetical protein
MAAKRRDATATKRAVTAKKSAATPRAAGTGSFRLELGGQSLAVTSIEGGAAVGVVVIGPPTSPSTHFREKHLSGIKYEPIAIEAQFGSARPLFDWIGAAWRGTRTQANGAAIAVDAMGRPSSRREFVKAVIAETTIPTLDATTREPALVTVRLTPERTSDVAPPTTLPAAPRPPNALSSNFRLSIVGLDCNKVSKIESFTVKQPANQVEFPNLRIELGRPIAETWRTWFRSSVIGGSSTPGNEKTGTLELLNPPLTTVLATISFYNLGIFRLEDAPADASTTAVPRVVADLYCERMEIS